MGLVGLNSPMAQPQGGYETSTARLCAILALLGLIGVASLVTLPVEKLIPGEPPLPTLARGLTLVQPALLVLAAVFVGIRLSPSVNLDAPVLRAVADFRRVGPLDPGLLVHALLVAIPTGLMIAGYGRALHEFVASLGPSALARLEALTLPLATRVLYGGIAEEVMVRWGLMTFLVWVVWRLRRRPARLPDWAYWIAALIAALVFAIGHLPVLYGLLTSPPAWLVITVLAGNLFAGVGFGYLFWRHGLEAAILAHALSHAIAATA